MKFEEILPAEQFDDLVKLHEFLGESKEEDLPPVIKEWKPQKIEVYTEDKRLCEIRDSFFERFSLSNILKSALKETHFEIENGIVRISNVEALELPAGYGYKGGAARSILRKALGMPSMPARDLDIIRSSESEPYPGADIEVSKKLMGNDYAFGDGVEVITDRLEYFQSRDFTVNEVIVEEGSIYVTEACIRDTLRNIIRVTDFERSRYRSDDSGAIGPKMRAKSLRLLAEHMYFFGQASIPPEDTLQIQGSFIEPFWLAVHLDRAFERSAEFAEAFVKQLRDARVIPESIQDSNDLGIWLKDEMYGNFFFRNAPQLQYDIEDEHLEGEVLSEADLFEDIFDKKYFGSRY